MVDAVADAFRHLLGRGAVTWAEWSVLFLLALAAVCAIAIVIAAVLLCRAILVADRVGNGQPSPDEVEY